MITLISSIDLSFGIGFKNDLLIKSKTDLNHFKKFTIGKNIVMGFNTFKSIGNPLENRTNIILTTKNTIIEGCVVYHTISNILKDYNDIIVIGGESIFNQFISIADEIVLTKINHTFKNVDTFFPRFDELNYNKELIQNFTENGFDFQILKYKKL